MAKIDHLEPVFIELMPKTFDPGFIYISIKYKTTVHLCASGCGNKVVLPLSPAEWKLTYDGESVSLSPSVGNWEFPCRAHYWVRVGRVEWDKAWDDRGIANGRLRDERELETYFSHRGAPLVSEQSMRGVLKRYLVGLFRRN
jgi:hypothetical protein